MVLEAAPARFWHWAGQQVQRQPDPIPRLEGSPQGRHSLAQVSVRQAGEREGTQTVLPWGGLRKCPPPWKCKKGCKGQAGWTPAVGSGPPPRPQRSARAAIRAVGGLEPSFLMSSPPPASFPQSPLPLHGPCSLNATSVVFGAGFLLVTGCMKATPQVKGPRRQCEDPRMEPRATA